MSKKPRDVNMLDSTTSASKYRTKVRRQEVSLKTGALQSAIFNSVNFSSIATDAKGVIQIFNVGAERMLGYTAADVMNKITPADISDPKEVIARAETLSAELGTPIAPGFEALVFKASRGIEDIYELTYIRKDGSRFPAVVSVTALRDAQDAIIGYLLIGTDNTARKGIEAEQKLLSQRLRDHQFYTRSLFESNIDALITNYELTARDRDGKETVVSYNATTLYDRDRRLQGVFAAARDITEHKQAQAQILNLALHDSLTQLPNRRLLNDRLAQAMAAGHRSGRYSALMLLDLDNFKSLNDTHGHEVGDSLLIEVADRLKSCVREIDTVARFGGDEFVVMISELSTERPESNAQAGLIAEKIRAALARPYALRVWHEGTAETTVEHQCTASIGVALFSKNDDNRDDIIKWADASMYRAKEAGHNLIRFFDLKA
jgi:diguanylate cyclase (GGDEF)-like protein